MEFVDLAMVDLHSVNKIQNQKSIPLIDLKSQYNLIETAIERRLRKIHENGTYILGPDVAELETRLASFAGTGHAICVGSGTDALEISLRAMGVGPGDIIFVPSYTFVATVEVVVNLGASPVFVDIEAHSFNMDPISLAENIERALRDGEGNPRGVIPVDLFGNPANYLDIHSVAERYGLFVLADAAQSFGAKISEKIVGQFADVTTTSFYPSKPLGCYGDGGCIFTNDGELTRSMRAISQHGSFPGSDSIVCVGLNSRLDTFQAAILIEKMTIFEAELEARQKVSGWYSNLLQDWVVVPRLNENYSSSWANYTILTRHREAIQKALTAANVASRIYYSVPVHLQPAYERFGLGLGSLPVTEDTSSTALSLPMHAYLAHDTVRKISDIIIRVISERS